MTIAKNRRPILERLESRRLLAVAFEPYLVVPPSVPGASANIGSITTGPDGNLWFTGTDTLGSINPTTHVTTLYPAPQPYYFLGPIVAAPDGNLYFAGNYYYNPMHVGIMEAQVAASFFSINPTTHILSQYAAPADSITGATPGPDGNIWYTDAGDYGFGQTVGVFNLTTHAYTKLPLAFDGDPLPLGITSADGLLWFTESRAKMIVSIDPTTHAMVDYPISQNINPNQITLGPDGNLWFSGTTASATPAPPPQIGEFNLTTHAVTTFTAPAYSGLTTGPDGNVWFTGLGSIGEINPITDVVTTYTPPVPLIPPSLLQPDPQAPDVITGPNHNLYFTGPNQVIEAPIVAATASITGSVTLQPAGDGSNAAGPLINQTVYVDLNNSGAYYVGEPMAITDAAGNYAIGGLAPGTYTVRVGPFPATFTTFPASTERTITLAEGQVGRLATFGVVPTSPLLPLTVDPNRFGSNNPDAQTAEVVGLYRTILDRAPDPGGQAAAVGALRAGTSVGQLAANLLDSPEFYADIAIADYKNVLGRTPAAAETAAVVSAMQGGLTPQGLIADLYGSVEFNDDVHRYPYDNAGFVTGAYESLLGRQASADEVSAIDALLTGGLSRASVIASLSGSTEALQTAVNGLYAAFLSRPADPAGLAAGMTALREGTPLSRLAISLAGSAEFAQRAQSAVG